MRPDPTTIKRGLTIPAVLTARGLTPRHRRMPCPIHQGGNRSSFSIRPGDTYARCWSCGWHGDVIALVQALDGCDFATAVQTCAVAAGLREQKPWERKPWLERQRKQREARQQRDEKWRRALDLALGWAIANDYVEAEREVRDVGALLAKYPDEDGLWRWLDVAVMERDQAEWITEAEQYARTLARCGEG